jgi:nucleotide-binding universal stress UspA family protein
MIVVGVDGSRAGLAAVSWAVHEARIRDTALSVVHVMPAWPLEMAEDARYADVGRWMRDGAMSMVTDALEWAREENPHVEVDSHLLPGDPRSTLLEAARDAELLVVGSHGLGGFGGMLLGSVALGVSGRTTCPVAVIRDTPARSGGEVAVGVDGSAAGAAALEFAFAEASLRGVGLRAVHAWNSPIVGCGPLAAVRPGHRRGGAAPAGRGPGRLERTVPRGQGQRTARARAPGGRFDRGLSSRRPPNPGLTRPRRAKRAAFRVGQPLDAAPRRLPGGRDPRPTGTRIPLTALHVGNPQQSTSAAIVS